MKELLVAVAFSLASSSLVASPPTSLNITEDMTPVSAKPQISMSVRTSKSRLDSMQSQAQTQEDKKRKNNNKKSGK